jgi:hypothetical protein
VPTFIRPARVEVTEGGGWLGGLVLVAAGAVAVAAVALFVLAHLVLLAGCTAVLAGGTLAAVLFLRRFIVPRSERRKAPIPSVTLAPPAPVRAPSGARRALATPVVHLHLYGVSPDDVAAIMDRRRSIPATPAIEEENRAR